jgi:NhaA family Na+:H+ antiporter
MTKLGIGALPAGLTARHIMVLGVVAGVGFTMALFVAQLAFGDPRLLGAAKIGVLAGSGVAAVLALLLGRWLLAPIAQATAELSADEAESSTEL